MMGESFIWKNKKNKDKEVGTLPSKCYHKEPSNYYVEENCKHHEKHTKHKKKHHKKHKKHHQGKGNTVNKTAPVTFDSEQVS